MTCLHPCNHHDDREVAGAPRCTGAICVGNAGPGNQMPRRGLLLLGGAAAMAAACRADADFGIGIEPPSTLDNGDASGNPGDDTGINPQDDGGNPADSGMPGTDSGVHRDSGTPMRDSGTTPMDSGTTPMDSGTQGPDVTTPPPPDVVMPQPDVYTPPPCTPVGTDVGPISMFAEGTWTFLNSPSCIVAQDSMGVYAYTTVCPHQGCSVSSPNPTTGATNCPCHGSEFDGDGNLVRGPARTGLKHFEVTVCMGEVYVDESVTVAVAVRASPTG